jgi:hypothetical protein
MELPEHIISKIMSYNSHPVADLFKQSFSWELQWLNEDGTNFYKAWRINSFKFIESEDENYGEDICDVCNCRMVFEDYCEDFVCWNETCRRNPENQPTRQYHSTIDDNSSDDDDELRPRQNNFILT